MTMNELNGFRIKAILFLEIKNAFKLTDNTRRY